MFKSIRTKRLIRQIQSPEVKRRQHAVMYLFTIQDNQVLPHLEKVLSDENSLVRYFAALGLGMSRNPEFIPKLLDAYNNEVDAFTRLWIGIQLIMLGDSSKLEKVIDDIKEVDKLGVEDWDNHMTIVSVISELGESCIPILLSTLTDTNETVRWISVMVLNELRPDSAIEPIKKLLEQETSECVIEYTSWIKD